MKHYMTTCLLACVASSTLIGQESERNPSNPTSPSTKTGMRTDQSMRCKASQLIGCNITNSKNESLGEIQEIVLDSNSMNVAYAVVGFGGFLGMGEKYFAMPWRLLEVTQRTPEDTMRVSIGLDHDTLKKAPGFDKGQWPDMANPRWSGQVDDYYTKHGKTRDLDRANDSSGSGKDTTRDEPTPRGETGGENNTRDETNTRGETTNRGETRSPSSKAFAHRRLSKLIGMSVVDSNQKQLADVEDLIVDTKAASVDAAVLSFDGTLGMNERIALVPANTLVLDQEKSVFVYRHARQGLEAYILKDGKFPSLNDDNWNKNWEALGAKFDKDAKDGDGSPSPRDASAQKSVPYVDAYDLENVETFKGVITSVGSVQAGDMDEERVRFRVRVTDGREVIVYAAPSSWKDQNDLMLHTGSEVEVTGSPTQHGTRTVLVAGSISVDGKVAKLRDDKGNVAWSKK